MKIVEKIPVKIRYILAYILGILGWLIGVSIGIIYALLYGGYQETKVIDLPTIIMENITPAIVSISLSNYLFTNMFPNNNYKNINTIIFYVILFLNYGSILFEAITTAKYGNIIYTITGVIYLIVLISNILKSINNDSKEKLG